MQILEQFYTIAVLACFVLFISFKDIFSNRLLQLVLLLLFYSGSIRIIAQTGTANVSLPLLMTGFAARLLFIPASYLYLRNFFNKQQLTIKDSYNLLPFFLFCAGCSFAYIINGNINFLSYHAQGRPLLTSGGQAALLSFELFIFSVTGFYLWLVLSILKKNYMNFGNQATYTQTVTVNGIDRNEHPEKKNAETSSVFLNNERIAHIDSTVKKLLSEEKPYLRHGYSLKQLSDEVQVPLHHLSAFINRHYKMNFNDFINEYRVDFCKVKIRNEEWRYKKLEAIAEESGFSNRNTFTSAFKKATGLNPSVYLKTIKEELRNEEELKKKGSLTAVTRDEAMSGIQELTNEKYNSAIAIAELSHAI